MTRSKGIEQQRGGRASGKVALVTGGGAGIGRACAEVLAREGASVIVSDVDVTGAEQTAYGIAEGGGRALALHHDVGDEGAWREVMARILREHDRLDVLVNNAGIGVLRHIEEETLEGWRQLMRVNLDGVFLGTKLAIEAMKGRTRGGSIVNVSSIEGLVGDPDLAAYNASKGGVRLLTKSAALHCARMGYPIRINSIHPGYIRTPMVENALRAAPDPEARLEHLRGLHPVGRLGEPEEVALAILYLASDESRFVTGSELVIDGGYTAQ